jgi:hypothetical protein
MFLSCTMVPCFAIVDKIKLVITLSWAVHIDSFLHKHGTEVGTAIVDWSH